MNTQHGSVRNVPLTLMSMDEPTEAELEAAAGDVAYEVVTMHNAAILAERRADLRERRPLEHRDTYLHIFTDAALIHARNVIEFLTTPQSPHDTVLAVHFNPGWDTSICSIIGRPIGDDGGLKAQLHQLVAHLSFSRPSHEANIPPPRWPFIALSDEIQGHYRRFLSELSEERRAWFDEGRANLQRIDPNDDRYRRRT